VCPWPHLDFSMFSCVSCRGAELHGFQRKAWEYCPVGVFCVFAVVLGVILSVFCVVFHATDI
jgi:hypothetical protein